MTPEEYLGLLLQQVGQTRLLVSQAHEVIEMVQAGGKSRPELEQYIQARAQDSMRGRLYAPKTIEIREAILALQAEYEVMTVRQIFYRLMTQKIVPKSEKEGYRPIQRQVLQLRRQGFLPWSFIADATRWVRQPDSWDSTDSFLSDVSRTYRRDRWRSQGVRIEIWLEKDALAGVLVPTTYEFGVALMVSRGQSSDTYLYEAAQAAKSAWDEHAMKTSVYTLYDSDKSGRSAAQNVEEKLLTYSDGAPITVRNLAVTPEQIEEWDLPTREAKEPGEGPVVELDAIDPHDLVALVQDAIVDHIDPDVWEKEQAIEESERNLLHSLLNKHAA